MSGARRRLFSSTATTTPAAAKPDAAGGGIPWFTIVPLSLVGFAVAYFYRGNRNTKLDQALRDEMRGGLAMSPEEMVLVREKNALSPGTFKELARRARAHFTGQVPPLGRFLDAFCMDQLGGEYQTRGEFRVRHVLERLERKLDSHKEEKEEEDALALALAVLSLTVFADPVQLCQVLFDVLKGEDGDDEMTAARFDQVIGLLDRTDQLPVRVLVKETKHYPFNAYERMTGEELAQRVRTPAPDASYTTALLRLVQLAPAEPVPQPSLANLSKQDFVDALMSTDVCVWGACWDYDQKQKNKGKKE